MDRERAEKLAEELRDFAKDHTVEEIIAKIPMSKTYPEKWSQLSPAMKKKMLRNEAFLLEYARLRKKGAD